MAQACQHESRKPALAGSGQDAVERAILNYKQHRDYGSLEFLFRRLEKGMERARVESLLGKAEYSPTDGLEYYSSNRAELTNSGNPNKVTFGAVLDYRDKNGAVTDRLQNFRVGAIGE